MADIKSYLKIVEQIKRNDLATISNARDLMNMAWNIKNDFQGQEVARRVVTSVIKKNWKQWFFESRNSAYEELYFDALLFEAPDIVDSFFRYLEVDDNRKFYAPRAHYLKPIIRAYQELYDGKLDFLSISQAKRTGKEQTFDSKVLTPSGFVEMGEIKVGSDVISGTGNISKVIAVFPHKDKEIYRVTFDDSSSCECGLDHLWEIQNKSDRKYGTRRVIDLHEILDTFYTDVYSVDCVDGEAYEHGKFIKKCKFIKSIQKTRYDDAQCIYIDDPSHLYITDDYIVTHNTSSAFRLVAMFSGRNPENGTLAVGHGEGLASVFYGGILQIFNSKRFLDVFPQARVVRTQADRLNIDLQRRKMFPTLQCRPIDGDVVGSTEARNLLYLDDTVKNHEEAVNRNRLDFLCEKVTGDVLGRRIPGVTPILIQGTKYSLYDPISKLQEKAQEMGWRWKEVAIPALDPITDTSNFEFVDESGHRLFTTEAYRNERKLVTPEVWAAEFQQEPFEAKGRMFPEDKLNRYIRLPVNVEPDMIVAACDPAGSGADYTACVVGYVYGQDVFVEDVVYDNSPSNVTKPQIARMVEKNKVTSILFESNNAGSYYGRDVEEILEKHNYQCSVRWKRSVTNKIVRIDEASSRIIQHFYFRDRSKIKAGSQYAFFMREITSMTRQPKGGHDDGSDALASLESFIRTFGGSIAKVMSREDLGI